MLKKYVKDNAEKICFVIILLCCILVRVLFLGFVPSGINQDEAYIGYEAFSLAKYGIDSWGYTNPCYFISWGSGMNVFYAYLLRCFFMILGYEDWVLRFPQAVVSVLGCLAFYCMLKKGYGKKVALFGFFIISVMPWNIMNARWGLESAMLPSCLMIAVWLWVKAFDDIKYLYFSFIGFGICFYIYAVSWVFLAIYLPLLVIYFWWYNKDKWIHLWAGGLVLSVFALPLFWFLLVNTYGFDEYKGALFSVPRLIYWRGNEWGVENFDIKLWAIYNIFILQDKVTIREVIPGIGLFYDKYWLLFILGFIGLVLDIKKNGFRAKCSVFILIWFVVGGIYVSLLYCSGTRVNLMYMPVMLILALSAKLLFRYKWVGYSVVLIYLYLFVNFCYVYFGKYDEIAQDYFSVGFKEALKEANKVHKDRFYDVVIVDEPTVYPKILWYEKINPRDFMKTIYWRYEVNAYMEPLSFLHYKFIYDFNYNMIEKDKIYIVDKKLHYFFYDFEKKEFGKYLLAIPR